MLLLDLKLVLFSIMLITLGVGVGIWWSVRSMWFHRFTPNAPLAHVQHELPFGVVVYSSDGMVIQVNAEGCRLLRAIIQQVSTTEVNLSVPFGKALAQAAPTNGLMTHPLPLRWWSYPLTQNQSLLVLVDNHEQQRLANQQHTFIGQLAHELRTPLTALIAHLEIVRNPATSAALRDASLRTTQHETHRLARLVRDLLELHRLETVPELALHPINLVLIAEEAITQVFPRIEETQLVLTFETETTLPLVLGHADRLKQVFLNVLDNAIKFGRPGDSIIVALHAAPTGVRCSITDTGPGIPPDDVLHVHEALYRGRTNVEGSGIGLALVSEILQHHHTRLSIESSVDPAQTGTTCAWTLPYAGDGERL